MYSVKNRLSGRRGGSVNPFDYQLLLFAQSFLLIPLSAKNAAYQPRPCT